MAQKEGCKAIGPKERYHKCPSSLGVLQVLGPAVGPLFLFLALGFPNPLKTKKGTLFIPGVTPGSRV